MVKIFTGGHDRLPQKISMGYGGRKSTLKGRLGSKNNLCGVDWVLNWPLLLSFSGVSLTKCPLFKGLDLQN
jgi:hypothetical protein